MLSISTECVSDTPTPCLEKEWQQTVLAFACVVLFQRLSREFPWRWKWKPWLLPGYWVHWSGHSESMIFLVRSWVCRFHGGGTTPHRMWFSGSPMIAAVKCPYLDWGTDIFLIHQWVICGSRPKHSPDRQKTAWLGKQLDLDHIKHMNALISVTMG